MSDSEASSNKEREDISLGNPTFFKPVHQTTNNYNPAGPLSAYSFSAASSIHAGGTGLNSFGKKVLSKIQEVVASTLIVLVDSKSKQGWKSYLLILSLYIYAWIGSLVIGLEGEYNFGLYGAWIWRVFNYLVNFSMYSIPYEAAIALSSICILLSLSVLCLFLYTLRVYHKADRSIKSVQSLMRVLGIIIYFGHLVMTYLMTSFIDCNYSSSVTFDGFSDPQKVLNRFPYYMCFSSSNIALIVLNFLGIICLILSTILCSFVLGNSHIRSETPFIVDNSLFIGSVLVISEIQITLNAIIPNSLMFVKSIIHILLSFTLFIMLLYLLPYYRRFENSMIGGLCLGKTFICVFPLISFLVNSKNEWEMGLAFATSSFGMFFIGFLIGFLIVEIYTRVVYKLTRFTIMQGVVECAVLIIDDGFSPEERFQAIKNLFEKEAIALFKDMEERKQIRNLELFLKFCMLSGNEGNDDTFGFSDKDMAICMIKSVSQHKRFQHKNLLVSSSLLCAYFWDMDRQVTFQKPPKSYCISSLEYSQTLLKRVKNEKMALLLSFMLKEKLKQIQDSLRREKGDSKDFSTLLDMSEMLNRLEKDTQTIVQCRKLVWKELMNDTVNENRVLEINRAASTLIIECEETFENLMKLFSEDKSVLRLYARFNEEVLFNTEKASELYQDAQSIEEEDSKRSHDKPSIVSLVKHSTGLLRASAGSMLLESITRNIGNRITPLSQTANNAGSVSNNIHLSSLKGGSKELVEDSNQLDLTEAGESPEMKKEAMYKSTIATAEGNLLPFFIILTFGTILGVLFLAKVVLALVTLNTATRDLNTIQKACAPSARSLAIISDLRVHQIVTSLFGTYTTFPVSLSSQGINNMSDYDKIYQERISLALTTFNNLQSIAMDGKLDSHMSIQYSNDSFLVYYPEIPHQNFYGQYLHPRPRNVSISTLTNSFLQHAVTLKSLKGDDFNRTLLTDFLLMYMWHNRDTLSKNFATFCDQISEVVNDTVTTYQRSFVYYCIASLITGCILCLGIASLQVYFSFKLRKIVKLFEKSIPKEAIGKIYHAIKANEQESNVNNGMWQNPMLRNAVLVILLTAIFLCCSIPILYITISTTNNANNIIENMQGSVRVAASAQITSLHIGEIYAFGILRPNTYAMNSDLLLSQEETQSYHEGIDTLTKTLESNWDRLIFGSAGSPSLVGKYLEIDALLKGRNCTQLNITSTTTCSGLNDLVHSFLLKSIEINEIYAAVQKDVTKVFDQFFTGVYQACNKLTDGMLNFMEVYVASVQRDDSQTWTIIIGVIGLVFLPIIINMYVRGTSKHFSEMQCLRMMLNYVKVENIDAKEPLRNYILFHQLEWIKQRKSSRREDDDKVRNVLNATVDGALLCNQEFEVDIYNPSAQRMFGKNMNEVVGLPLWNLFGQENKERIQTSLQHLKTNTGSIASGETLEIDCVRKNGTRFPAKLNISWTTFDGKAVFVCFIKDITTEKKQNSLLAEEKKTSENLLRNILPESVAKKLKNGETFIAEKLPDITCFFSDMVGFTKLSSSMNAHQVVKMLGDIVNGFDSLTDKYELEKIKTIGDAYFCVGGLHQASDHAERVLRFAIETFRVVRNYNQKMILEKFSTTGNDSTTLPTNNMNTTFMTPSNSTNNLIPSSISSSSIVSLNIDQIHQVDIRVGLNTGAVVAGVIGTKKFAYDLWGDTINVASRMESTSLSGRIQISRSTYERVHDLDLQFEERKIEVKGKGVMQSYLLSEKAHERAVLTTEEIEELRDVEAEKQASTSKNVVVHESENSEASHDHVFVKEEEADEVVLEPSVTDLAHYTMKSK